MIVSWHPDIRAVLATNAGIARLSGAVIARPAIARIWYDNTPHWPA